MRRRILLATTALMTAGVALLPTGDARYAPITAAASVQTRAAVVMAIGGYYASKHLGSVTYRLYHRAKRLTLVAAVVPNKAGECVRLQLEEHAKGIWRDGGTPVAPRPVTESALWPPGP